MLSTVISSIVHQKARLSAAAGTATVAGVLARDRAYQGIRRRLCRTARAG